MYWRSVQALELEHQGRDNVDADNAWLRQQNSELEAQNADADTQIAELQALLAERDGAVEALHAVIRENCMSWEVGKWAPTDEQ